MRGKLSPKHPLAALQENPLQAAAVLGNTSTCPTLQIQLQKSAFLKCCYSHQGDAAPRRRSPCQQTSWCGKAEPDILES